MFMVDPPHPGEILRDMYLEPLNLTVTETAKKLDVSRKALSEFVNGKSNLSIEMAARISKAFGTELAMWLNMQLQYDVNYANKNIDLSNVEVIQKAS